ncbi:hypothetical protein FACS1894188_01190 [Clostridia bacterium]|nr:hypothetical protein FACS1894188_01190 [Clostridia bacterium]
MNTLLYLFDLPFEFSIIQFFLFIGMGYAILKFDKSCASKRESEELQLYGVSSSETQK